MTIQDGVIKFGGDASELFTEVAKIGKSLQDMARQAKQATTDASKGIDNLTDATNKATVAQEKAEARKVASIQRTTAALMSGGRANSEYFKTLEKLQTQKITKTEAIAQLAAAERATLKLKDANLSLSAATDKNGLSAKQLRFAMRGVPAQFTDIFTSLQGGQAPMTVFLQQGGQLKDMFGGAGNAAKALSGYVLGLINPFTLGAGAVVGLAGAYAAGANESTRLNTALITSGNIVGGSVGRFSDLAEEVGKSTGAYSTSREAIEQLAASGKISYGQIETALRGVVAGTELTGRKTEDLVKDFESLSKKPVEGIFKLNETQNFLTESIFKQIIALEKQGKTQEATDLATKTYADTLESRKGQVLDNLGLFETAWLNIKKAADGALDSILAIGRDDSLAKQVQSAEAKLNVLKNGAGGRAGYGQKGSAEQIAAQEKELANLQRMAATEKFLGDEAAKRLSEDRDKVQEIKDIYDTKDKKKKDNSGRDTLQALKDELDEEKERREDIDKFSLKIDKEEAERKAKLIRANAEFAIQQFDIENTDRANKTADYYKGVFAKEKQLAKDRKDFWDSAEESAHRVWTNLSQDGVDAFKQIGRTLKTYVLDLLYQMTVKKWFISIAATASGTASASTGGGSSLTAGAGDLFSTIKNAFSSGNASVVDSIQSLGTFLSNGQGGLGDMLGGAISKYSAQIADVLPYAGAAMALLQGDIKGAVLQGAGVAIGSAIGGPIGGAIGGALGSALGGLFGGHISRPKFYANSTVTQDSVNTYRSYGNSDASGKNVAKAASGGIGEQLQALATSFDTSLKEFTLGVHYSQKYNTYSIAVGNEISKNGKNRDAAFNAKDADKQQNAIAQSFLVAVKKGFTELPQYLVDIVSNSSWNAKTESVANLGYLGQIKALKESLATLPPVFEAIGYAIGNAKLSDADALTSQLSAVQTYTDLFYTEQEQFATYTKQIGAQFGALNLAIPDTRDGFRALVDGIKVVDDASAKQFNALIDLAPAMDTYYTQLQEQADATKQAEEATKALIDTLLETKNFKSLVDFNRAKNYQSLGISLDKIPSYDVGTAYVPNDGLAMIHKGERIIPATENAKLIAGNGEASNGLLAEVKRLREENQAHAVAQIQAAQRMQKVLEKIDRLGIVLSETDNAGNRVTIDTRVVV